MEYFLNKIPEQIISWISEHGWRVLFIILGAFIVSKFGRIVIEKIIRRAVTSNKYSSKESEIKREDTLITVFDSTIKIIIWLVAVMIALSEFGIDTTPLVAGAGVLGLAFGFGAQYLIRDIISGFFIIMENQYRVGDIIQLDGATGTVEDINLRMTILRDVDGVVHYIPNGTIQRTSNMTKTFSVVNLNIGVSYNDDVNKVEKVINEVGQKLAKDKEWGKKIKEAPQFIRVEEFGDSAVIIRVNCKTRPASQWEVAGEIRKRIKQAFDKEGIEIPYPQVVEHRKSH